ncbi:MAG TPA: DUF3568 family protein [Tepidisphaeraceae bacterium]|jgi:hypothetical protein|nr:DUF3568 family protein [Tepidisphaeraceae bacterium]
MRGLLRVLGLVSVMSLILVTQSGCLVAAAAGAAGGTVAYMKGDVEAVVDAGVERTFNATKAAMDDLKLPLMANWANAMEAHVEARVGTDNKATVNITGQSDKLSKVSIRVGTFGDQGLSQAILEKIKANLNTATTKTAAIQ